MALGDAYATAAEYRSQVAKTGTGEDTLLGVELTAVSRYIDRKLGRRLGFNKDGTSTARVYVMGRGTILDIDDHVSVASVEIGDHYTQTYNAALDTSAYVLRPRSAGSMPESQPYRSIEFLTSIPGFEQLVRVTGIGGWNAVPSAVKTACIELTAILRMESPRATNRVNEIGQVLSTSRVAQNIIQELLEPYRMRRSAI